jgi:hypothetical protein
LSATLAAGFSYYKYSSESVLVFGKSALTWLVLAASAGIAMFVGEVAGNYILPKVVPYSGQLSGIVQTVGNPLLCAGSTILATNILAPPEYTSKGFVQLGMIGAGSYVAADYLAKNVFKNYLWVKNYFVG